MSLYIAYIAFICTPHFADGLYHGQVVSPNTTALDRRRLAATKAASRAGTVRVRSNDTFRFRGAIARPGL